MRTQWHTAATVPIPGNVPAKAVLDYVQSYVSILNENPSVTSYEETFPNPDDINGDPFFAPFDQTVRTFQVRETILLAPGLTKDLVWPGFLQLKPDGIRIRSDVTTGIIARTQWTVRRRQEGISPASDSTASTTTYVGDEWELIGEMEIDGNRLIMPFVTRRGAHVLQVMCQGLVDGGVRSYFKGGS